MKERSGDLKCKAYNQRFMLNAMTLITNITIHFKVFIYICYMRLRNNEIAAIKEVTREVFGDNATIGLFGSRKDNNKKGGDIDLFIQCNCHISREELYQLKIKFLVLLKNIIGDQKIDVLINAGQLSGSILETVRREEVRL